LIILEENNMRKLSLAMIALFALAAGFTGSVWAADRDLNAEVAAAKADFLEADESMSALFSSAAAYAIIPKVTKGGLGVGGAKGAGLFYQGGAAIGTAHMSQFTIGFQAGGQIYSEAIFFETAEAAEKFKAGKFEFAAQVSAVAAAAGVSRDAPYQDGIKVITHAGKGLMYEASVGGQKFGYEPL
jgi:lipid-binding SYLF domain-containing protein